MIWRIGAVCGLLSLAAALLAGRLGSPERWVGSSLAGWGLALANGTAGLALMKGSLGGDMGRFVRFGVVGNGLRFALLLGTLVLLRWRLPGEFMSLALATVAGSLVFMAGEVRGLYAGWRN